MQQSGYAEQIAHALANPETRPIYMDGPANRKSGYGNHFVELVLAMLRRGADVRTYPHAVSPPLPPEFLATLVPDWNYNAEVGFHMANPTHFNRVAHHTIGITTWETTKLPRDEAESSLKNVDELIVTCKDHIPMFADLAPHLPCHYIPEGVDTDFFCEVERDWNPEVIKLGMFGALSYRKGLDLAIEAFLEHFQNDPKVELHLWTSDPVPYVLSLPMFSSNIHVNVSGTRTREEVRSFYHNIHALFHPYRGEGWWMPGAEMMATGGIVIAPNLMGPSAYHKSDTGWVIPAHLGDVKHWADHHGIEATERYGKWVICELPDVIDTMLDFVNAPPSEKRKRASHAAAQIPFLASWDDAAAKTIACYNEAYDRVTV